MLERLEDSEPAGLPMDLDAYHLAAEYYRRLGKMSIKAPLRKSTSPWAIPVELWRMRFRPNFTSRFRGRPGIGSDKNPISNK
eukprot:16422894-Heterocapsa_arctica.AAC.1